MLFVCFLSTWYTVSLRKYLFTVISGLLNNIYSYNLKNVCGNGLNRQEPCGTGVWQQLPKLASIREFSKRQVGEEALSRVFDRHGRTGSAQFLNNP